MSPKSPDRLGTPKLLEVAHVAHRLRVSPEHVRRLIRSGQLPASHLGTRWRVDPADLQAFEDNQRCGCNPSW